MYGHIHLCLRELVLEKFGPEAWSKILKHAGSDDSVDFMQFQQYPDALTERLLSAAVETSGIERAPLLELYGEYFYHYVARRGYDNMLRTLGEDYVSFLKRLDFLHTLLATTYDGMIPPHFRCEESDGEIYLHVYSTRGRGLCKIAVGLAREVGIKLFNIDARTELLSIEALEGDPHGYVEYAVIRITINGPNSLPETRRRSVDSIASSECPISQISASSNVVLPHCEFRRAAPYHILLDESLRIQACGVAIPKLTHVTECGNQDLTAFFTITKPKIDFTFSQIILNINKSFILLQKQDPSDVEKQPISLKGRFMETGEPGQLAFLGSPYFASLRELANNKTCLTNFPKDDIVRELFFISEKAKVEVQISKQLDSTTAQLQKLSRDLEEQNDRTDELLNQMLPRGVAMQLRDGHPVEAEKFEEATVLFSDIVEFTSMAAECEPMDIVSVLNELFQRFDDLTSVHDVYKSSYIAALTYNGQGIALQLWTEEPGNKQVETIGDAYMVVSGVPEVISEHALRIARMSLDMVDSANQVYRPNSRQPIQIRVGVHTGPVVAGVVGQKMPRYCLFGDTVNTASRMESHGLPNRVHVSSATHSKLQHSGLKFQARGMTRIKGKGKMFTYFIIGWPEKTAVYSNQKGETSSFKSLVKNDLNSKSRVCMIL